MKDEVRENRSADRTLRLTSSMTKLLVSDYNQGTLVRTDSSDEYTQNNTIFVLRLQFYVFEIARCRRGLNDWIWEKEQKEKRKAEKK